MRDTVLLTGATGAIGQALTEHLARCDSVDGIFVLSRSERNRSRPENVTPVFGDVTAGPDLGMEPKLLREALDRVTIVLHAAADTRFSAAVEESRAANAQGTRNVLGFASHCPRLRALAALSTVHVAGRRSGRILEEDLHDSAGFVNAYEQSKYEAEKILRERMGELPISVLRLSLVFGDSVTGEVAKPAAVHHALRLYYNSLAPMIPGTAGSPVDLIATDYAASAVAYLATRGFQAGRTFHICGGEDVLTLEEMLRITLETFLLHRPAWRKRAIAMPTIVDLDTFELFVRSVMELGDGILQNSVRIIENFVPQLAFPKIYANQQSEKALECSAVRKPLVRHFYPKVVRWLIETNWGTCRSGPALGESGRDE